MIHQFRKTVFFGMILLSCIALSLFGQVQQKDKVRDGVFVHISHGVDSPHRLLMALKMAVTMAEDKKDVLVYCDIEAVKVLVTGAQTVTFGNFPSSHELLNRLKELKVTVTCLPHLYEDREHRAKRSLPRCQCRTKGSLFFFYKRKNSVARLLRGYNSILRFTKTCTRVVRGTRFFIKNYRQE